MQLLNLFNIKLDDFLAGNEKYFKLLILSLLIIISCKLCAKISVYIIKKINKDSRTLFLLNQNINIISNLFIIITHQFFPVIIIKIFNITSYIFLIFYKKNI